MKKLHSFLFFVLLMMLCAASVAQNGITSGEKPQMADGLRSSGKIYVVVIVVVTILLGFIFYLIHLDRKIGRLEKEPEASRPR